MALEQQKSELLRKVLKVAQFCAGQGRNNSKLRNGTECEKEINDDMPLTIRSVTDPCEKTVKLVASFSSAIFPISFSSDDNLENVVLCSLPLLILC